MLNDLLGGWPQAVVVAALALGVGVVIIDIVTKKRLKIKSNSIDLMAKVTFITTKPISQLL
jgi:hypothetical protein